MNSIRTTGIENAAQTWQNVQEGSGSVVEGVADSVAGSEISVQRFFETVAGSVQEGSGSAAEGAADSVAGSEIFVQRFFETAAGSVQEGSGSVVEASANEVNGCSGGMDRLARWWSRVFFSVPGKGKKLAFTGCCDEHDLFYEQGGCSCDRAFADRILRGCIAGNLKNRKRPLLVRLHVPFFFWCAVRVFGWYFWASSGPFASASCSSLSSSAKKSV